MVLLSSVASVESFLWFFLDRGLASLSLALSMDPVTHLGYLIGTFSVDNSYFPQYTKRGPMTGYWLFGQIA